METGSDKTRDWQTIYAGFNERMSEEIRTHNTIFTTQMKAIRDACNIFEFTIKTYQQQQCTSKSDKDPKTELKMYESLCMFKF